MLAVELVLGSSLFCDRYAASSSEGWGHGGQTPREAHNIARATRSVVDGRNCLPVTFKGAIPRRMNPAEPFPKLLAAG